jgi:hypothetical protein
LSVRKGALTVVADALLIWKLVFDNFLKSKMLNLRQQFALQMTTNKINIIIKSDGLVPLPLDFDGLSLSEPLCSFKVELENNFVKVIIDFNLFILI